MADQIPPHARTGGCWASPEAAAAWQENAARREEALTPATALMLDLAGIGAGMTVLDVAAGTGEQSFLAARRVGPSGIVIATDIAESMLTLAAARARELELTNISTQVVDAQELAFAPDSCDAVISRFGLMFMPRLRDALAGFLRVLKPGGKLAAMVWSLPGRNPLFALPLAIGRRYRPAGGGAAALPDVFALSQPGLLADAFGRAGFLQVREHPIALELRVESLSALIDGRQPLGPLGAVLARLEGPERELAEAEVLAAFREFAGPGGLAIPGEVLIVIGAK
jgi:SAM-dependent methyltransferase